MRPHGTRARYVFGPGPGQDRSLGCRCEPCSDANRRYARERDRAARRPDVVVEPAFVDATEARAHLLWLRRQGIGIRTVAARTGLGRTNLSEIVTGRRSRVLRSTAARILAVGRSDLRGGALVPADRTWRLIEALRSAGWTKGRIAMALGASRPALQLGRRFVTVRNARRVEALARLHAPGAWARIVGARTADLEAAAERQRRHRERAA